MIINHNMNALNAHRMMTGNTAASGKSMEKLSSGLRINRAGDDAAGLAISEKMRGQIRGLDQAARNSQDGISMIQTAEGALNETHSILQRMRELATQASNDTNTGDDRKEIQKEINQLTSEINRIGNTTEFNTQKLLDGGEAQRAAKTSGETSVASKTYAVTGEKLTGTITIDDSSSKSQISITVGGKTAELTLTDGTYDGTSGKEYSKLVDDINAKIQLNADIKDKVKAELKDGAMVFTSAESDLELAAGTKDVLGDIKVTAAKGTEQKSETDSNTSNFNATLQIGANKGQAFQISINDMRAVALGIAKASSSSSDTTDKTYAVTGEKLTGTITIDDSSSKSQISITVGGKTAELTLTDGTYDGTSGKEYSKLVDDINAKIQLNADIKDKVKAELKDGAIVFTSAESDLELAAGTKDVLGDIKVTAAKGTEQKSETVSTGSFTSEAGVSNGTDSKNVESALDVSSHENATAAIDVLDKAIAKVSGERSKLGAYQNRLEHTIANLGTSSENLTAAESRVRDVDMAKEMMQFSKNNILSQAAQAMLAQAQQQPQGVLQLLR